MKTLLVILVTAGLCCALWRRETPAPAAVVDPVQAPAPPPAPFRWEMPRGVTTQGMATIRGVVVSVQDNALVIECEEPRRIWIRANASAVETMDIERRAKKEEEQAYGPARVMYRGTLQNTEAAPTNFAHGTVMVGGLPDPKRFPAGTRVRIVAALLPVAAPHGGKRLTAYSAVFEATPETQKEWNDARWNASAYWNPLNQPARR